MNESKQDQGDSILAYLAATAPALIQLLAVTSVGLVNLLKFDKFVLSAGFLNIANFIVVLLTVVLISLYTYWEQHKFLFFNTQNNLALVDKNFWEGFKKLSISTFILIFIFLGVVLNKPRISSNLEVWICIQWGSYILGMTFISFIVFIFFLTKIKERQSRSMQQNFIPRLLDSLRRYGHVKNPDVIVETINRFDQNGPYAIVKIKNRKFFVRTDFTGEMITIEPRIEPTPAPTA